MIPICGPALAAAVLASALTAAAPAFRIADARITEASGLAFGLRSPGIAYVQNDSGDTNRFFALDRRTGATAATITVRGATNVDWEDLAVARDAAGVSRVWLADTGDNDAARREVRLYRVREPRVGPHERGRTLTTEPAEVWRLRYPDGPADAEALAVTPTGAAYVITKSLLGLSTVYRVPPRPDRRHVQSLERVGRIDLVPHGIANPFGIAGELAVTGAAISPDGSVFAIRTYAEAYLWRLGSGRGRGGAARAAAAAAPAPPAAGRGHRAARRPARVGRQRGTARGGLPGAAAGAAPAGVRIGVGAGLGLGVGPGLRCGVRRLEHPAVPAGAGGPNLRPGPGRRRDPRRPRGAGVARAGDLALHPLKFPHHRPMNRRRSGGLCARTGTNRAPTRARA